MRSTLHGLDHCSGTWGQLVFTIGCVIGYVVNYNVIIAIPQLLKTVLVAVIKVSPCVCWVRINGEITTSLCESIIQS